MGIRQVSLVFRAMARYHLTTALAWRKVFENSVGRSYGANSNTGTCASSGIGFCATKTNTDPLRKASSGCHRHTNARTTGNRGGACLLSSEEHGIKNLFLVVKL